MGQSSSKRTARVASLMREVLAEVLRGVKDPRVTGITVTDVEVSGDLREAKIYIANYTETSTAEMDQTMKGLSAASSFIRREIGQRIQLRSTPALRFYWDRSLAYGARIETLLNEIRQSESGQGGGTDDDD